MGFDPVSERVLLNVSLEAEKTPLKKHFLLNTNSQELYGKPIVKKMLHQQYSMHT